MKRHTQFSLIVPSFLAHFDDSGFSSQFDFNSIFYEESDVDSISIFLPQYSELKI